MNTIKGTFDVSLTRVAQSEDTTINEMIILLQTRSLISKILLQLPFGAVFYLSN
ncbi:hypothetical protein [Terrilactibacillus laevilacticus]|uniref:Uncharacterized protein n=1 Tax=Terrilactibacillus laevilacticus TaxID=1380157 RepID=A0ABW5PKJ7_9BACI